MAFYKNFLSMTLNELIEQQTGYHCFTTFANDFAIAERFGIAAVKDTFNRAFNEWKSNVKYLTEFVMILNWKIWQWYQKNDELARVYDELWRKADEWACENLKGEDADYYYSTTD